MFNFGIVIFVIARVSVFLLLYFFNNSSLVAIDITFNILRLISLYFDKNGSHIRPREINAPFVRKPNWGSPAEMPVTVTVDFVADTIPEISLRGTQLKTYPHFPYSDYDGELTKMENYSTPSSFLPYLKKEFEEMETSVTAIKASLNKRTVDCRVTVYVEDILTEYTEVPFGELCFPNRKPFKADDKPGTDKNPLYLLNDGVFTCEENGSFVIDTLTAICTLSKSTSSKLKIFLGENTFSSIEVT